ncbi:MAG: hypothetical protein MUD08_15355, partial [Cytophagales bacterium]|nr:hypothetical protein [Cytophagales bacterium]
TPRRDAFISTSVRWSRAKLAKDETMPRRILAKSGVLAVFCLKRRHLFSVIVEIIFCKPNLSVCDQRTLVCL